MKNFYKITLALAVMLISGSSFAQTAQDRDNTLLNVRLQNAFNIEIGQDVVNIPMNQADHFINGSSSGIQNDHLQITATSDFTVDVEATRELTLRGGTETIAATNVEVQVVSVGTDLTGGNSAGEPTIAAASVPLEANNAVEVLGAGADLHRGYNVTYTIPAANAPNFLNQVEGVYSTRVVYTLMAD